MNFEARDSQGNLIKTSTLESFSLDFTDLNSVTTNYPAVSLGEGVYESKFLLTTKGIFTLEAKLGSTIVQNWSRKNLTTVESDCIINFPQTAPSLLINV